MVINVATGKYLPNPTAADLIDFDSHLATLPTILSNRYEEAFIPVEMANGVFTSTYFHLPKSSGVHRTGGMISS